jgi:hypothetical protein
MFQEPATSRKGKPRVAVVAGHLGEFLQGRCGPRGEIALITLPCPVLRATAAHRPGPFTLHQPQAVLGRARAVRFLRLLKLPVSGRFVLKLDMPPGGGAGASTAALVALARAAGAQEERIAAACLAVEGASDPLMFAEPGRLLWASRAGRVFAEQPPLPRMDVLGGFYGPPLRTESKDDRFPVIDDLLSAWPAACSDPAAVAQLASISAGRTLALRGPAGDPTESLALRLGALGFAIGHTGSARALFFSPGSVPEGAATMLRNVGWTHLVRFRLGTTPGRFQK